jgi:hypothetical protein
MILKYSTDLAVKMGNRMHYPGVRSTALKIGGGSAKGNKNQPIHCVLRPEQLVTSEGETV